jgi:hypothetical protein
MIAAVSFAGCYASTEPATNVGIDKATLNARGTANNGPAHALFQYELNGRVGDPLVVGVGRFPAGASGPFSANVADLAAGTEYSFRVCGYDGDNGSPPGTCANTRTFTTKPPVEDAVHGSYWFGCCATVEINARSGPSGENARGYMTWHNGPHIEPYSLDYRGFVKCLAVDGPRAFVSSVGERTSSAGGPPSTVMTYSAVIVDGRTAQDQIAERDVVGSTTPDCSGNIGTPGTMDAIHEFIVDDAQP